MTGSPDPADGASGVPDETAEPTDQTSYPPDLTKADAGRVWYRNAQLPLLTAGFFLVFALVLWINAAVNHYRFNVAIAVLGSVPLAVLLIRALTKARAAATTAH